MVESRGTSKLREMIHRFHLLMESLDDKNAAKHKRGKGLIGRGCKQVS